MHKLLISGIGLTLLGACSSVDPTNNETTATTSVSTGGDTGSQTGDNTAITDPTGPTSGTPEDTLTTDASGGSSTVADTSATDGESTGLVTATEPLDTTSGDPGSTTGPDGSSSGSSTTEEGSSTGGPPDADGDNVPDPADNCPMVANEDQADADMNGIGDACEDDDDDDDDGLPDDADNCPLVPNPDQKDLDMDGVGDACDEDKDGDNVLEPTDNCPLVPNPDQKDTDKDGIGDLCDPDKDGDNIPNDDDVFPDDGGQPGVVVPKKIYAHSSSALSTVDVVDYTVTNIGTFQWPNDGGSHQMTDVAIDRHGVLYGITFERAYVCNPTTAACFVLGTLPGSYNGLTWIPAGTLDPNKDSLIGISQAGVWTHLKIMNGQISALPLGTYGAGYTSAGDAFSIEGVGTYAAVNKQGVTSTVIVSVDPLNGKVLSELAVTQGFSSVFGLAGWEGLIIAFNSSGDMIKVDPQTKAVTNLGKKNVGWWGAGVGTILPQ